MSKASQRLRIFFAYFIVQNRINFGRHFTRRETVEKPSDYHYNQDFFLQNFIVSRKMHTAAPQYK